MKGLLQNYFYAVQDTLKLSMLLALLPFVGVLFASDIFGNMGIGIILFIFSANLTGPLQADETAKWIKFELTLPVRRSTVVLSKYYGYMIVMAIGLACSIVLSAVALALKTVALDGILFSLGFGAGLSFLMGALLYPLIFKLGAAKSEMLMVLSAIVAIAALIGLWIGWMFFATALALPKTSAILGLMLAVFGAVAFAGSYFVSLGIYKKKEF